MRQIFLLLTTLFIIAPVTAQTPPPWEITATLDDTLFEAQKQLLLKNPDEAIAAVTETQTLYSSLLTSYPTFPNVADEVAQAALVTAQAAAERNNSNQLAAARGQFQTAILLGSYDLTQTAIENGDIATAQQWLLVRDFRPSTRFDRPGADATLALNDLEKGLITTETAQARVEADLYDTYQGNLIEALNHTGETDQFFTRRSESAGLAQGYWRIIAATFANQYGTETASTVNTHFEALVTATIAQDEATIQAHIEAIQSQVQNFRAAQLSSDELIRRTGQLLRYTALVPVEYERGVEDGQIFLAFEIQEAVTFMRGAQAAFADLRPALYAQNPDLVEMVQVQLDEIETDLAAANRQEAVIPVAEMKANVKDLNKNLSTLLPEEWNQLDPDADFDVIAAVLDQVEAAVASGQYNMAESAHLEAYAVFDFGPEPRLLAFAPELVARIDGLFWQGIDGERGLAEAIALQESPETIQQIRSNLDAALVEAQRTLGDLPSAPGAIITNAAIIVFREGLEAVVILAALTASFVGVLAHYRRYVGLGALLAFIATIATGVAMQQLLSSFARFGERLEAVVSLVAIGVILLITNWFFHKAYWNDHLKDMHQQKSGLMKGGEAGRTLGLITLGFTSIYREGFETALFLQALLFDAGVSIVLQGVLLGLIGVGLAGIVTFALQRRLPYMQMFVVTGILIGVVLFTMVGNTVHVMQKVGWMSLHPIRGLTLPYWVGLWFGVFPTWEGIGWQLGSAAFVIGSYYLAQYLRKRKRDKIRQNASLKKQQAI